MSPLEAMILKDKISNLSVTDDDDCRSVCSYYSLPELEDTNPVRRIMSSEVSRQAGLVPESPQANTKYPHEFRNREDLPLRVIGPWKEHPVLASGHYISDNPGPARVIVSSEAGGGCDVIYHPARQYRSGRKHNTFVQARYHPRQRQSTGAAPKPEQRPRATLVTPPTDATLDALYSSIIAQMAHVHQQQCHLQALMAQQYLATQEYQMRQHYLAAQQRLIQPSYYPWTGYLPQTSVTIPSAQA